MLCRPANTADRSPTMNIQIHPSPTGRFASAARPAPKRNASRERRCPELSGWQDSNPGLLLPNQLQPVA